MCEVLTEKQIDILRSKYRTPVDVTHRLGLLYRLDKHFQFNRTKLSKFLKSQGLYGYSRQQLERLLGKPIYRPGEYRYLLKLMKQGKLDPLVLELQCSTRVHAKINKVQLGTGKGD